MTADQKLTDQERAIWQWQMWVEDFGETGQEKLKGASVLISRCGGVGGIVAYQLAAAGIGRLVIAHRGDIKPSDLNRQLALSFTWYDRKHVVSRGSLQHTDSSGSKIIVDRSTWNTFYWNEFEDVFVWKPQGRVGYTTIIDLQ